MVNKEIVIEEDVHMATGVRVMDSDGHPRDTEERAAGLPPNPEEVKPVRVCKGAWIGQNTFIMKGVTIGEGAVVGVNSVVLTDVPAFCTAMGNPARVVSPPWPGKNKSAPTPTFFTRECKHSGLMTGTDRSHPKNAGIEELAQLVRSYRFRVRLVS